MTDLRTLPFSDGQNFTSELLFQSGQEVAPPSADVTLVIRLCERLPKVASILTDRREERQGYPVSDEYDVQDLLQAVLRGYLTHSVQEDPLPKVAGARSSRVDLSIEDLGVIIEVKYARKPADHKRFVREIGEDVLLYAKAAFLKTLIVLVYNSGSLKDAEGLEKLSGSYESSGVRFDVHVILS